MGLEFAAFVGLAILSTSLGAFFALKLKRHLQPLIGLSAGMLIAVAFFDLMPEAFALTKDFSLLSASVICGFLFYLVLERFILFHSCNEEADSHHYHHRAGFLGMAGLTMHRAIDGLVIGFAFNVSPETGAIVSLAIAAHSFPDGVNAATLMLARAGVKFGQWVGLLAVSLAIGSVLPLVVHIPTSSVGVLIGFVAGWFLYIGASDLLPETHKEHANLLPLAATIIGIGLIYIMTSVLVR